MSPPLPAHQAAAATPITYPCWVSELPTDAAQRRAPGLTLTPLPGPARFYPPTTSSAVQAFIPEEAQMLRHVLAFTLALIPLVAVLGLVSVTP